DIAGGLIKPLFFGAAIALISCERGFTSQGGAEGVGRAATQAFVFSFMAVLGLDFFLGMFDNALQEFLWPGVGPSLMAMKNPHPSPPPQGGRGSALPPPLWGRVGVGGVRPFHDPVIDHLRSRLDAVRPAPRAERH